jgi:hypothetical protein
MRNVDYISFELFAEIFGSGFPSSEGLQKIWDSQKVKREGMSSDNLLDYFRAGNSLFKDYGEKSN